MKTLVQWYRATKRDLPWRRSQDPYRVWISEIMLQQTTVQVVVPYYTRFVEKFPDVQSLAAAREETVLGLWSGLGYYSRARNLHRAAKEIVKRGSFPATYEALLTLPGIGPYTAAAVASIAFNEEVPSIDGNVIRVLSRLYDIELEVTTARARTELEKRARELITGEPPGEHNQAVMELGATICVPQNPACLLCPVSRNCRALKAGTVTMRPVKNKKRKQEPWLWEVNLCLKNGKLALVKSDNGTPWLKNTWVFPGTARPVTGAGIPKSDLKHSITHHKIFVRVKKSSGSGLESSKVKWVALGELEKLGVSSIVRKVLENQKLHKGGP